MQTVDKWKQKHPIGGVSSHYVLTEDIVSFYGRNESHYPKEPKGNYYRVHEPE